MSVGEMVIIAAIAAVLSIVCFGVSTPTILMAVAGIGAVIGAKLTHP